MKAIATPLSERAVRALAAGDVVEISGRVYTGRDKLHKHFADGGRLPVDFRGGVLYHCGPVCVPDGAGGWKVVAAGPTTSVRENPYEPDFIAKTGARVIVGKGGMNARVLAACKRFGAVYLQAVGGAAAVTAQAIRRVPNVYFLDTFGAAEACWEFLVEDFRCVVGMDSHGTSLFAEIETASKARFDELIA